MTATTQALCAHCGAAVEHGRAIFGTNGLVFCSANCAVLGKAGGK